MRWIVLVVIAVAAAPAAATAPDRTKLPLGDQRYQSTPRTGYVDSCQTSFPSQTMGAFRDGPWIDSASGTWDMTSKLSVQGDVAWPGATRRVKLAGSSLFISGNGLPAVSGTFPIQSSDPAYAYDRNPNSIRSYTLSVRLPSSPKVNAQPTCVGGTIGVTKTGIPIYSAFDANGRDAVAHEVQDRCGGHPQISGQYHFHGYSRCASGSGLWGYALDGFGIYGPGSTPVSSTDLDVCHGITSKVRWHGKTRRIYHYVATDDFPYLVGCYRGTPITSATGLAIGRPG